MPDVHAILSASSAHRWIECPPSVKLCEDLPDTTSEAAEEGTLAHSIVELKVKALIEGADVDSRKLDKLKKHKLFRPAMLEHVDTFLLYVLDLWDRAVQKTPDAELLSEVRVDFSRWVPDGFGTSDVVIIADGEMDIVDFKYGKGVAVNAHENPQLRLYALGALEEYDALYGIDTVRMHIVQPRLESTSCEQLASAGLYAWADSVARPAALLAARGDGEQKAGDWCRFCKVKSRCRARAEKNLENARAEFGDVRLLSDTEIGDLLGRLDEMKRWCEDLKGYALEQAQQGVCFDGWKLVAGRTNRRISDKAAAEERLAQAKVNDFLTLKSLTELEEQVGKKRLGEILGELIVKPEGGPSLVPASDKRPEWGSSAAEDFAEAIT